MLHNFEIKITGVVVDDISIMSPRQIVIFITKIQIQVDMIQVSQKNYVI